MRRAVTDEPEEVEEADDEVADDDSSLFDGEAFFLPGKREICEQFGLLGLTMRDGFLCALKVGEGEVLFSDVLKRPKDGKVAPMRAVKK
jgi:hypothetical protein